jgi:hypothetical protein
MDPERQGQQPAAADGAGGGGAPVARRPMVGDGGASWRLKALKRAQEQAKEKGGDVSTVRGARQMPEARACHVRDGRVPGTQPTAPRAKSQRAAWHLPAAACACALQCFYLCPRPALRRSQLVAERWGSMAELTKSLTNARAAHGEGTSSPPRLLSRLPLSRHEADGWHALRQGTRTAQNALWRFSGAGLVVGAPMPLSAPTKHPHGLFPTHPRCRQGAPARVTRPRGRRNLRDRQPPAGWRARRGPRRGPRPGARPRPRRLGQRGRRRREGARRRPRRRQCAAALLGGCQERAGPDDAPRRGLGAVVAASGRARRRAPRRRAGGRRRRRWRPAGLRRPWRPGRQPRRAAGRAQQPGWRARAAAGRAAKRARSERRAQRRRRPGRQGKRRVAGGPEGRGSMPLAQPRQQVCVQRPGSRRGTLAPKRATHALACMLSGSTTCLCLVARNLLAHWLGCLRPDPFL